MPCKARLRPAFPLAALPLPLSRAAALEWFRFGRQGDATAQAHAGRFKTAIRISAYGSALGKEESEEALLGADHVRPAAAPLLSTVREFVRACGTGAARLLGAAAGERRGRLEGGEVKVRQQQQPRYTQPDPVSPIFRYICGTANGLYTLSNEKNIRVQHPTF
ncbi:hypothetical protein MTO96_010038 [Rhipicephalus appendiculatus]